MASFQPYLIHHLQLDHTAGLRLPAGNHYLVFWEGARPLGHLWLESAENPLSLDDYRESITAVTGAALHYSPPSPATPPSNAKENQSPELSVVVCTRDRPLDISRCLEALLDSNDKTFELIVVDNAPSDDQTKMAVARFPTVRYVREARPGLDIARNTGIRAASHPLIAFTDDDVLVDSNWIGHLKTSFDDPLVMAVTGLVIPEKLQTRSQYIFERYWGFNKGYLPKIFDHRFFLDHLPYGVPAWDIGAGANMAFRKEVFDLVGYFDERLDVGASGCSGDSELWYRILAEGWNCAYLPHLFVYHRHRESGDGLRRQLFYYMRGHVSALLVQYERYGHPGEQRRLLRGLPSYYLKRIKDRLLKGPKDFRYRENFNTLLTEIKGCLSGYRFYRQTTIPPPAIPNIPPEDSLRQAAILSPDTLVSVIIPSFNHGHFLPAAIQSIVNQTYKHTEIIVVDDGSTDNTVAVIEQLRQQVGEAPETIIKYVRVDRVGPSAARNIGVQYSHGDFIVFLDADDLLYPNAIELNLSYFQHYPLSAFISGAHDRIDELGNNLPVADAVIRAADNYSSLLQGNYIAMEATVLYRRNLFFRFHFDPAVNACEDYDLNLRIARQLPVFGHATKLAAYRIHASNRSKVKKDMLMSALSVLAKQEPHLQNEEERRAYQQGLANWHDYYHEK